MLDCAAEAMLMNMVGNDCDRCGAINVTTSAADSEALSAGGNSMDGYDIMLERHHDSLIEEQLPPAGVTADGIFASSLQNLYDANG